VKTKLQIPFANLKAQFEAQREEIWGATKRVLASGWYILGDEVKSFEHEFAAYLGASHCVGVANGTDAIALALLAVGVGRDDEVITVSQSAVATVAAIEQIGAIPVFADISPETRCLDPELIAGAVSSKTRAVIPVHLYGHPAPMIRIIQQAKRFGLAVIEDCAQAHGAEIGGRKVGTFGDAAAFSFYPTKNLGALGDGGAVVTNSVAVANRLNGLRQYGWHERYISAYPGINSRLDEMQAAILRLKLPRLDENNERRRDIGTRYTIAAREAKLTPPQEPGWARHVMHLYVVESEARESFREYLHAHGVATAIHYPLPIHQQPAYLGRIRGSERLPETERLAGRIVSLPMYPELTDVEVDYICSCLNKKGLMSR
jgi:dTDP-4-amino-4,6-dideoxygalactose transaminase